MLLNLNVIMLFDELNCFFLVAVFDRFYDVVMQFNHRLEPVYILPVKLFPLMTTI